VLFNGRMIKNSLGHERAHAQLRKRFEGCRSLACARLTALGANIFTALWPTIASGGRVFRFTVG
jgi:hypothetical protein